ncbi:helix-turn-helix domain-containing protein [Micromonospora sp. WMMD730]|uniref:helix-turn-helix domain-containing protein n=1 Tax=Micromonospora sp. WMMD730 TaxID=3404128 RepID=UPI003B9613B5
MTDPTAAEVPRPGVGAPPAGTRRPAARDELRAAAVALRGEGRSVGDIAARLGVAKSTAYLWVRHLPLDPDEEVARERRRAHSKVMTDARWSAHQQARDAARAAAVADAAAWVGSMEHRELVMVGAALYWAEGEKTKPWRPHECRVRFINSDPGLVGIFVRFVEAMGVSREALRFRVSIHETADAEAAVRWWAERVAVPAETFRPTSFKRHRPTTVRRNTGEEYRGCLIVEVPRSRQLYWRIEGIMKGMGDGAAGEGR